MSDDDKALVERLKWEMRLAENLLSDCQKHLYGEGIAPPENVIAGIRERLKCSLGGPND